MAQKSAIVGTLQDGWNAMSTEQRAMVGILGGIDLLVKTAALIDLTRADAAALRGPKVFWAPVVAAVNTLGWAAYFTVGKRRSR